MSENIANILWIKALHDYNAAENLQDSDPEIVGDQVIGLLLQQSVEKAIKSTLLRRSRPCRLTGSIDCRFSNWSGNS